MSKTVLQRFTRMAMLLAVLLLPLSLHAQNMTLQLKDVTVQEAVTRLQSQGNYTIVVNSEVVDLQKRITVSAKDQPLDKVLAQIFAGQNVEFVINGNSVSVNRKSAQPASQETSFRTAFALCECVSLKDSGMLAVVLPFPSSEIKIGS